MVANRLFTTYPGMGRKGFDQTVHAEVGFGSWKNQMNVKTWDNICIMPDLGPVESNGPGYTRTLASAGQVPDRRRTCTESHQGHRVCLTGQPV